MRILRATHLGFCFGVRDAIAQALDHPGPITVLGELVHNKIVLDDLRSHGIETAERGEDVRTPAVMISAHGASDRRIAGLRAQGLTVVEATCPLVRVVHRAAQRLVAEGFHPIIIGKPDHAEVLGLTEDLAECDVIQTEDEVRDLRERPRFGVVAQTTQPLAKVQRLVETLRAQFPQAEVRWVDTVCQPTKYRQTAAMDVAVRADVMIVIGGANSNNTRELVATCARFCPSVHHVQSEHDLDPAWLDGATTVGLTAGTSTPDDVIAAIENRLQELAYPPQSQPVPEEIRAPESVHSLVETALR